MRPSTFGSMSRPGSATKSKPVSSKKKPAPNGTILNFFQKAAIQEESMFVARSSGMIFDPLENSAASMHFAPEEKQAHFEEQEYLNHPTKRQKLSQEISTDQTPETQPKSSRRTKTGPFVEDSDSEEEDEPQTVANPIWRQEKTIPNDERDADPPTREVADDDETRITFDSIFQPQEDATDDAYALENFGDFSEAEIDEGDINDEDMKAFALEMEDLEDGPTPEDTFHDGSFAGADAGDNSLVASCPICGTSLDAFTPDSATVHVNKCLDGLAVPPPAPPKQDKEQQKNTLRTPEKDGQRSQITPAKQQNVSDFAKRFARTQNPRPAQANPIPTDGSSNSAFAKLMSNHAENSAWATAAAAEMSSRGKQAYERTCPFYKVMPGFFICVDAFRYGAIDGCNAYFLSHFHSDHYIGLTAKWCHGPIYCSKVTGSLVKSQLGTAGKYVVELEFEQTVEVPGTQGVRVTMIPANHCPGSSMFLFEKDMAGSKRTQRILHCGDFRACPAHVDHQLLRPETVDVLSGQTKQQKIDVCYLDTTYLNPRYAFPPQDDVISACASLCALINTSIVSGNGGEWDKMLRRQGGAAAREGNGFVDGFLVKEEQANDSKASGDAKSRAAAGPARTPPPSNALSLLGKQTSSANRLLVVCGTYSIGKERICKSIAQALGTKIFASPAKIKIIAQLGDPELTALMTSNPAEAQVHMQMIMEIRAETLAEYLASYRAHFSRIIGFRPSGWNYRPPVSGSGKGPSASLAPSSLPSAQLLHGAGWRSRFRAQDLIPQRGSTKEAVCLGVPYSEHSSFRELALFLMALRIEKVVPTVNVGSQQSRQRMKAWIDRWTADRRKGGLVEVKREDEDGVLDHKETKNTIGTKGASRIWEGGASKGGYAYW